MIPIYQNSHLAALLGGNNNKKEIVLGLSNVFFLVLFSKPRS